MGRYVRAVLRDLAARPNIELTLLSRDPGALDAYRAIAGERVTVAPLSRARVRGVYDGVWYPWNGIRFGACAPAVVTINDDFAFAYPARGFVARLREQAPIRRAIRRASRIVTISSWSRGRLMSRFGVPADRIGILPLGPDAYFTPGTEASPFREPFVVTVGTGEARKNVALLIDAFARAFPLRDVRLAIVGAADVSIRSRLTTARIDVLERVDDEELRRLYRTAAAVAVPSLAEGFGLVAVEAQACGGAVIAARSSALPEAVGDAGMLVDPNDGAAWAEALRALVREPELNASFRARAAARWLPGSSVRTTNALLAALERAVDDRV